MIISFNTIKQAVKRQLSIIGKRLADKEGRNIFSNITVSTAEDPIFEQYILSGIQNIEALLRPLVTSYVPSTENVTITLRNTRGTADFDIRCGGMITSYVTLFTVGEYLWMTHPELTEKYRADTTGALQSVLAYAFYKEPPAKSAYDPISSTTTITA